MTLRYPSRFFATIAVLAVAFLSAGVLASDPEAGRYYEDALSRFNADDPQGALIQLNNSLQRDPGQLPAKILLGRTRLALGHPKAAEEALMQARQLGADDSQIALPLAQARNQLGRYKLNTETIRPVGLPPDVASSLWVELGLARLALGDTAGARIAFEEALKIEPGKIGGTLGLVSVFLEERDYESAETLCNEALTTAPGNADAWFIMGTLLEFRYQLAAAEAHFTQALQLSPQHFKAQLARAIVVLNLDRPTEAVSLFEEILRQRPWSLEAAYLLSQSLAVSGQPDRAEQALQHAAGMVSSVATKDLADNPRLLLISSLITYDTEQYESSFELLNRYLQHKPTDVQARKQLAKLLSIIDKPLAAIRELRSLAVERPKDAQIQVMLGDINIQLKDYVTAERHYATALALTTPSTKLISRVGLAQHGQGHTDLAIETMQRLVELAPGKGAGASIFLGILYLHQGDLEAARTIADHIASRMPDNLLAINLQAVIAVAQKRPAEGRTLFGTALAQDPDFDPARINLIKLDILEGHYDRAKQTLDELIANDANNKSALRTYAELAMAQQRFHEAKGYLERIRAIDSGAVRDILLLSRLYEKLGQPADALSTVIALEQTVPDDVSVKLRLAEMRLSRGDIDEARSVLVDAAQLAGTNSGQRAAVAKLQIRAGALDDAIQGMQLALDADPNAREPRLVLARIHALQNRLIQADATASTVLEMYPSDVEALSLLGDIRLARGQIGSAIEIYRHAAGMDDTAALAISIHKAMILAQQDGAALAGLAAWNEAHPGNEAVMGVLADHYARIGHLEAALALYREIIEINPRNLAAHNNLAVALLSVDSEQALKAALRAYELAPNNPAILDTVGWVQVQVGDLETGLSRLREAVTRSGHAPEARYHLAVALEEYGNLHEALKELRRALASDQPFAERMEAEQRLRRLELLAQ